MAKDRMQRVSGFWCESDRIPPLPSLRAHRELSEIWLWTQSSQQIDLRGSEKLSDLMIEVGEGSKVEANGSAVQSADITIDGAGPIDFRNCKELTSFAGEGDGPFLLDGCTALRSLYLRSGKAEDLSGWNDFRSLGLLDLRSPAGSFPPLPNLSGLTELRLHGFPANEVPWRKLIDLERIWLSEESVSGSLDLSSLSNLHWVSLDDVLPGIVFTLPSSVTTLRLQSQRNPAEFLRLSGPCKTLGISYSSFEDLPGTMVEEVEDLTLSKAMLGAEAWVKLGGAPKLRKIWMGNFGSLPGEQWSALSRMPSLEELHLYADGAIPPVDGFPSLRVLVLDHGQAVNLVRAPRLQRVEYSTGTGKKYWQEVDHSTGVPVLGPMKSN